MTALLYTPDELENSSTKWGLADLVFNKTQENRRKSVAGDEGGRN